MANSKLENTYYNIPENVLNVISTALTKCDQNYAGRKKAEFLLNQKKISYENLKRYKNFFDNHNRSKYDISDDDSLSELNPELDYILRGGKDMRDFVEDKLKEITSKIENEKKIKTQLGPNFNMYKKEGEFSNRKINTDNNFIKSESLIRESNNSDKKMVKVSLSVIFNNENKILLLKRSTNTDWCPDCWALVGGKIEKNESPEIALIREVSEETKIDLNKYKFKRIVKYDNVLEYLYLGKVDNNDVQLNGEHSEYNWFTLDEIKKLDNVVPELINYIKYTIL